ncbi:MAG: creatininase family protein [Thermoplasmata archaeon]|nr:MAG: creatininase family protein [Thermoplasmata archaeon]
MIMANMTMEEFKKAMEDGRPVIIPVGAVEAHGNHLPLATDTIQPEQIAMEVAERIGAVVAPTVNYGVCKSLKNFPGTISLSFDTMRALMREIIEGFVQHGAKKIMVISGHAGQSHMIALREAAYDVVERHDVRVMVFSDYDIAYMYRGKLVPEDDGHAGTLETSRVLAIMPQWNKKLPGENVPEYPKFEVVREFERYFPNCYRGDPSKASAELGKKINEMIVEHIVDMVRERWRI